MGFTILRSILSSGRPVLPSSDEDKEVTDSDTPERPCFVCSFFKNNSTHTTKVLEDGSVVHINKTVIADTDEDGNSFFFHRAVFHNVGSNDDSNVEEEEEEENVEEVFDLGNEEDTNDDEDPEDGVDEGLLA